MSELTVTEFVTARLDEWEKAARAAEQSDAWGNPYSDGTDLCYTFTPERVLAQCAALRQVVALVTSEQPLDQGHWEGSGSNERWVSDHAPEILRDLASIWSDHPDWREEWRA